MRCSRASGLIRSRFGDSDTTRPFLLRAFLRGEETPTRKASVKSHKRLRRPAAPAQTRGRLATEKQGLRVSHPTKTIRIGAGRTACRCDAVGGCCHSDVFPVLTHAGLT